MSRSKTRNRWAFLALAATALALAASAMAANNGKDGFGFNARDIRGFPAGAVSLTGGGAIDVTIGVGHSGGGFRCTEDVVGNVPLNGCLAGQGVRWDTEEVLRNTGFKCTGAAGETQKTAVTGDGTVVLQSDFYRAGDGNDESFQAKLIISDSDLAPELDGVQNVWIQGVGCGSAIVHFGSSN
jgi:hypothetical protein